MVGTCVAVAGARDALGTPAIAGSRIAAGGTLVVRPSGSALAASFARG